MSHDRLEVEYKAPITEHRVSIAMSLREDMYFNS